MILIALLLPLITRVRASAINNVCKSNLRQIGMGIRMYADDNKGFYPDPYTLGGSRCRRMFAERDPTDPASPPEKYGWPSLLHPYLRNRSENNVWRCPARDASVAVCYAGWTLLGSPTRKTLDHRWDLSDPALGPRMLVYENLWEAPYKSGVFAPLDYPPGREYGMRWFFEPNLSTSLPYEQWQSGPHHYRLNSSIYTQVGNRIIECPPDGYLHFLDVTLSLHTLRNYIPYVSANTTVWAVPIIVD